MFSITPFFISPFSYHIINIVYSHGTYFLENLYSTACEKGAFEMFKSLNISCPYSKIPLHINPSPYVIAM